MNSQLLRTVTTIWNDPAHRVKPADLVMNMTPMVKQSTRITNTIVLPLHRQADVPDYSCSPWHWVQHWAQQVISSGKSEIITTGEVSYNNDTSLELRLKIKDDAINLGTALAEYRQSARMFGSAATAVADAWRVYKGKIRRKTLTPCDIPAAHLIYTYGVSPLINDVYDSIEELVLRLGYPLRRRYFASAQGRKTKQSTIVPATGTEVKIDARMSKSKRVTAYVEFDLENASRFTVGNPLEIAWELVPYSFVFDWMFTVGDYLTSLDALRAVSTVRTTTSEKVKYSHNSKTIKTTAYGPVYHNMQDQVTYESHERFAASTIPLPSLPTYKPSKSLRAVANGLALLAQSFGQRFDKCRRRRV